MQRIHRNYLCSRGGGNNPFSSAQLAVYSPFEKMAPMHQTVQMLVQNILQLSVQMIIQKKWH